MPSKCAYCGEEYEGPWTEHAKTCRWVSPGRAIPFTPPEGETKMYPLVAHIELPGEKAVQYRLIGLIPRNVSEEIRLIEEFKEMALKDGFTSFKVKRIAAMILE